MAANLPELYKNNVRTVGDRRKRCSVHSPNATQWEFTKQTYLNHASTTAFHIVYTSDIFYNLEDFFDKQWVNKRTPTSEIDKEKTHYYQRTYTISHQQLMANIRINYCELMRLILSAITLLICELCPMKSPWSELHDVKKETED